ncbi:MAG: 1-acyl-sn-glycerol-3-phosphate acyltransferase [Candidatus Competibacterales bacterium]
MGQSVEPVKLVDLSRELAGGRGTPPWWLGAVLPPLEAVLGIRALNRGYRRLQTEYSRDNFFWGCLRAMEVTVAIDPVHRARLAAPGPVLVVGNHPFGGLEGIVAGALLSEARGDVRLLANFLLHRIPEIRPWLIEVDPLRRGQVQRNNRAALRAAFQWLRGGGALVTFPAGTVAHWQGFAAGITDPPWHDSIARLALRAGVPVLPVYFPGRNGALFQLCGAVSRRARLLLLAKALMDCRGREIAVGVGEVIGVDELKKAPSPEAVTGLLRRRTYALAEGA